MTEQLKPTPTIKLVVIDIDGTLLNSQHQLTPRVERAVHAAVDAGVQVILATGKTRTSSLHLIEQLKLDTPGIYLQGLTVYEPDGKLRYQQSLDPAIARQVITFAEDRGFHMIAYSGAHIMVRQRNQYTDSVTVKYNEPEPESIGALQNVLDSMTINKIIAVGDPRAIKSLRWQLNAQLNGAVRLTQAAVPHMLEVLPPGASKGASLKMLLKDLQIANEQVMAIGDAENDIEMIQLAGIGVAVGNAEEKVKAAAKHHVASNDEDGVAEAIERFVLGRKLDAEAKPAPAAESKSETAPQPPPDEEKP